MKSFIEVNQFQLY